jgi:Zn-dependent protease
MHKWKDLIYILKNYNSFTPSEIKNLIITIAALAFIISFKDWGSGSQFELGTGLINLFIAIIIVTISVLWHELGHRITASSIGQKVEYKLYSFGILAGILLAIITNGNWWFLIVNGIVINLIPIQRLGFFKYGPNMYGVGQVAAWGPLFSIILAFVFKILWVVVPSEILLKAIHFNIAYAVWNILPIPPADGSRVFFGSRLAYIFEFAIIIVAGILLFIDLNIFLVLISTILMAVIIWLLYLILWEQKFGWTKGPAT